MIIVPRSNVFRKSFTRPNDCIFGDVLQAQFQNHIESADTIKFFKGMPRCGVLKESKNKRRWQRRIEMINYVPHGDDGDYLMGMVLRTIGSKMGKIKRVSHATSRHGGQISKIYSISESETSICFIEKPISVYQTDDLDKRFNLSEVINLVGEN